MLVVRHSVGTYVVKNICQVEKYYCPTSREEKNLRNGKKSKKNLTSKIGKDRCSYFSLKWFERCSEK